MENGFKFKIIKVKDIAISRDNAKRKLTAEEMFRLDGMQRSDRQWTVPKN